LVYQLESNDENEEEEDEADLMGFSMM